MKWRIYLFRADKFDEERVKAMTDKQVMYAAWDMSCNIGGEEELVALLKNCNVINFEKYHIRAIDLSKQP